MPAKRTVPAWFVWIRPEWGRHHRWLLHGEWPRCLALQKAADQRRLYVAAHVVRVDVPEPSEADYRYEKSRVLRQIRKDAKGRKCVRCGGPATRVFSHGDTGAVVEFVVCCENCFFGALRASSRRRGQPPDYAAGWAWLHRPARKKAPR